MLLGGEVRSFRKGRTGCAGNFPCSIVSTLMEFVKIDDNYRVSGLDQYIMTGTKSFLWFTFVLEIGGADLQESINRFY